MQKIFEDIAQPFQTGEIALPAGVSLQTGIIAHTRPTELRRAITEIDDAVIMDNFHDVVATPNQTLANQALLARSVKREIGRLGRRSANVTLLATMAVGLTAGIGSAHEIQAGSGSTIESTAQITAVSSDTLPTNHGYETRPTIAAVSIGAGSGALAGLFAGNLLIGNFAHRRARKALAKSQ